MSEQDALLDIKQAAGFLNVSETSLRRWTNEGILPCLRVGRRRERRFRRADLLSFLEEQPPLGSGPAAPRPVPASSAGSIPGLHSCHLYTTDGERNRLAGDFLRRGIEAGGHGFFLARRAVYDAVLGQIGRGAAARITHLDYAASAAAQFALLESEFRTALRAGAPAIFSIGDAPAFPAAYSLEEVTANELAYDRLAQRYRVTTACLYDVRRFTSMQLVAALRGHHDMLQQPLSLLLG